MLDGGANFSATNSLRVFGMLAANWHYSCHLEPRLPRGGKNSSPRILARAGNFRESPICRIVESSLRPGSIRDGSSARRKLWPSAAIKRRYLGPGKRVIIIVAKLRFNRLRRIGRTGNHWIQLATSRPGARHSIPDPRTDVIRSPTWRREVRNQFCRACSVRVPVRASSKYREEVATIVWALVDPPPRSRAARRYAWQRYAGRNERAEHGH